MRVEPWKSIMASGAMRRVKEIMSRGGPLSLQGVHPFAQPFVTRLLRAVVADRALLVVTEGVKAQERFHQDLTGWEVLLAEKRGVRGQTLFYPGWEVLPHESRLPHADVISERLETLIALQEWCEGRKGPGPVVVAPVSALMQRTFQPQQLRVRTRRVSLLDQIDPLDLVEWLEDQGYEPEAKVTQKGEIALRGGILDLYPPTSPWPVRLEFFGNELDSMRYFDPGSQVSREKIEGGLTIPPAGELGILRRMVEASAEFSGGSLFEFLGQDAVVVWAEPELIRAEAEEYEAQVPEGHERLFAGWEEVQGCAVGEGRLSVWLEEGPVTGAGPGRVDAVEIAEWNIPSLEAFRPDREKARDPQILEAQRQEFFDQLDRWLRRGYWLRVFCNNEGERDRFEEICRERRVGEGDVLKKGQWEVQLGSLSGGFIEEESRLVVVTDSEVFGRYKIQRPRRLKSPHAVATRSALDIDFSQLEEGDYVVHVQHGIGRYLGLQLLPGGQGRKGQVGEGPDRVEECLVLEYAASQSERAAPKLYVPVSEAHLVSKYVGTGRAQPALNTLGGSRWAKAKEQAAEAIRDLASELLSIQAAREGQEGYALGPDTPWQLEFENAFIYEETADQLKAISETKQDLESRKPMDRLICGDVGFGKTEVAIRAAFKAVMGGKQVAVLVPTTILAQQHYNTLSERMADYPVKVELLSRFRTRREQSAVLGQLREGSVDIVVGTHRLLQGDVGFKDLGLVVIDEEQRFGVMHKERFKMLRRMVDVLTLSATPIPRTLYLALTGARDMSTIETPPQDRLPVETIVAQYDERLIRDALQRELNREGQVYFLHNRVMGIQEVAAKLQMLVPKARIVIGHGQMDSDELEKVMTRFINGEADILVSTTIIESGIDIPNANTIIIDRADRFGLSDLYQLRGRVGRYKHQAYAYLLLPRHATLLADVRKRISAMRQYSSLGSGFKIAMRDLEIRGAGNLLGAEQSGHITAVGFELYCQLLKQSISSLKGEKVKRRVDVSVRLDFITQDPMGEHAPAEEGRAGGAKKKMQKKTEKKELFIEVPREVWVKERYAGAAERGKEDEEDVPRPAAACLPVGYVPEPHQRIEIYRKLAQAADKAGLEAVRAELRDRFGPLPSAAELLLQVTEMKVLASEREVTSVETRGRKLLLTRRGDYIKAGGYFPRLTEATAPGRLKEIKRLLLAL